MTNWGHALEGLQVASVATIAVITSFMQDVEWWLRVTVLALTVLFTGYKLLKAWRSEKKGNDDE